MEEVLVRVAVPLVQIQYDLYIPCNVAMNDVKQWMLQAMKEVDENTLILDQDCVLCRKKDHSIVDVTLCASELGLCNGEELMLI